MTELETLLADLVSINSINPDLVPGSPGEGQIAAFIAAWMQQARLEVHVDEVAPARPNVTGIARGKGGGRSLMLNGHMDIVGIQGMQSPLEPVLRSGRMYGRGTYDMKAGLACCLMAARAARQMDLRGDVIVSAVMDEEYAGLGTLDIAKRYRANAAIVAESTELRLVTAHRGFAWLEIETTGVAAHGSRPDLGLDAITKMGKVLVALEQHNRDLLAHPIHPLLKSGSLHAALIRGGQELSSYPQRCILSVERRTLPGETPQVVEAQVQQILDRLSAADPDFHAAQRPLLDRIPLETPADAPIVQALQAACQSRLGAPAEIAGVPYWTDAASLWAAGIPSVLFGPSGTGAHANEEWVDLDSMQSCARVLQAAIQNFCK